MMEEKILAKVEELSGQLIDTIVRMVQIDSVEAEAEPDAPFGRGGEEGPGRRPGAVRPAGV